MLLPKKELIAVACAMGAIIACSASKAERKSATDDHSAGAPAAADPSDGDVQGVVDCSRIFSGGDAVGILNLPATVSNYAPRPGSCHFTTANEGGSIIVYGGSDMTSEMSWNDGTQSRDSVRFAALPGVGDAAVRLAKDGTEILSRKGKVYCSVELAGIGQSGTETDFTKTRGVELARKLGVLCNKYFAAK